MAKRPSTESYPDPFDDEFQDLDNSKPGKARLEDSDPNLEDIDYDALEEPAGLRGEVTREPVTVGQIIGGALQVILQAVLVLVVFLAIGFGVVFAGQRIGIVPQRAASVGAPNIGVNLGIVPTSAPTSIPPTLIPPTPTLAPGEILDCASAASWWNSQQVQDNFTYFTQTALTEARGNDVRGIVNNLNVRRGFIANVPTDPCMMESRDILLRAFDSTIAAIGAIGRNDAADTDTQIANANAAYEDLRVALAKVGVTAEMPTVS